MDTSRIFFTRHEQRLEIEGWIREITEIVLRSHCQPRLGAIVSWSLKEIREVFIVSNSSYRLTSNDVI